MYANRRSSARSLVAARQILHDLAALVIGMLFLMALYNLKVTAAQCMP
jgi:hypothetical protein